jgi:hypothetical protein
MRGTTPVSNDRERTAKLARERFAPTVAATEVFVLL